MLLKKNVVLKSEHGPGTWCKRNRPHGTRDHPHDGRHHPV